MLDSIYPIALRYFEITFCLEKPTGSLNSIMHEHELDSIHSIS